MKHSICEADIASSWRKVVFVTLFAISILSLAVPAQAQNFTGATLAALERLEKAIGPDRPSQLPTAANMAKANERKVLLAKLGALKQRFKIINPGSPEQQRAGLERLGYTPDVAQKIARLYPRFADELLAWADVDLEGAKALNLYRGLTLAKGIVSFDPMLNSGLGSPVHVNTIYIAKNWKTARDFAFSRAESGGIPVLFALQAPQFMVVSSPLQMGDSTWPMIRATDLPDPNKPDLTAFVVGYAEMNDTERSNTTPPVFRLYPPR